MLKNNKSDHFTKGHGFLLQKELYVCIKCFVKCLGTEDKGLRVCFLKIGLHDEMLASIDSYLFVDFLMHIKMHVSIFEALKKKKTLY